MTSPEPKLLDGPMPIRAVPAVPSPPLCFRRDDNAAGTVGLTGLSLLPPSGKASVNPAPAAVDEHRQNITGRFSANMPPSSPAPGLNLHTQSQQQQSRKARRCWSRASPAVCCCFASINSAGHKIREVMQVDGLTNDEVKSHLQKYRLHNRRSPGVAPVNQSIMLVGGGLWVPQEQSSSQSGSPQGPLQFSGSGVAISAATVGGDSSSSDEDDKSDEGYSRK
ncbi:putative transcription factor GLK1 [Panicum miliaceum]|uniref:Transcription factor GLK1 n=1 Tax=Panicum miliaceum TaxID=4540 RepID=A0A3L6T816_PANMI|nr:putative transcription factor GLK1 [Panicum miliaceum]